MKEVVLKLHSIMSSPKSPQGEGFIRMKKQIIANVAETLRQKRKLEDLYVNIGILLSHDTPALNPAWLFVNELTEGFKEIKATWQRSGAQTQEIYYKTPIDGIFVAAINTPPPHVISSLYTLVGSNYLPR